MLNNQILSLISFGSVSSLLVAVGMALIGLAFTVYILRKGQAMAGGHFSDEEPDDDAARRSEDDTARRSRSEDD